MTHPKDLDWSPQGVLKREKRNLLKEVRNYKEEILSTARHFSFQGQKLKEAESRIDQIDRELEKLNEETSENL